MASEKLESAGAAPPEHRTLLANGFDVNWVMRQVGHADSTMTLDVDAQFEQRADRIHGTSFDALIRHAEDARRDAESVMKWSQRLGDPEAGPRKGLSPADSKRP